MDSEPRTREARARAEEALVRFALLAGDHTHEFVVIGGLNPEYLAADAPVSHQGTTDVDLLFAIGLDLADAEHDFSWLDAALDQGGFTSGNGWRWDATLGDARVRLEFLADVWDHTADTVSLPGSRTAVATKLAGPAAALIDPELRDLPVPPSVRAQFGIETDAVTLRFANLGGYLLAKAAAAQSRMLHKDKYDLMYVTLYNPGGAAGAATAVARQLSRAGDVADPDAIRAAMAKFVDPDGAWAEVFADTMAATGDSATEAQLRTDAAIGAQTFLEVLDASS